MTLRELMADEPRKERFVGACVETVEAEVRSKSGLSGMAVKAGFAAFQKIRPGITRAGVLRILPRAQPVVDDHWARAGADPERWFAAHRTEFAEDLLGVTDKLAERASNRVLVGVYRQMRAGARDHVEAAVPRVVALLRSHLGVTGG